MNPNRMRQFSHLLANQIARAAAIHPIVKSARIQRESRDNLRAHSLTMGSIDSGIAGSLSSRLNEVEISDGSKRTDYLSWEDYFMTVACAAAMRSKDPSTQVGCVIVDKNNIIVGTGYNGFPIGISDDEFPWSKGENPLRNKHTYVVHAEMNAVLNKISQDLDGCTLYTTLVPCNQCAKLIIQSRIARVVYKRDRDGWEFDAAKLMFDAVNIQYGLFTPKQKEVTIRLGDD